MNSNKKSRKLTERERYRYDRQIIIRDWGEDGQKKLKSTTALVAGIGGLGSSASTYLAAVGIGKLKIVDSDEVEVSNLNRQVLYGEGDIGREKAIAARESLQKLNGDIEVEPITRVITDETIGDLIEGCDLIVDCLDNYETRYVINRASLRWKVPLFHAAVRAMRGQATTVIPGETPCLKCIIPTPPPSEKLPMLGATPGLMGCIQAHEVVKYVIGIGDLLKNELLLVNRGTEFNRVEVQRDPGCQECGGGD